MTKSNQKRKDQLGMPYGTAQNRLRKQVMFSLLQRAKLNVCFQCGEEITDVKDLSIEHKIPWLDSEDPQELFWDLDNIAFSHLSCNCSAARHPLKGKICGEHGGHSMYFRHKCRCDLCKEYKKLRTRRYRARKLNKETK